MVFHFDTDGGTAIEDAQGTTDQSFLNEDGSRWVIPTVSKPGYTFKGWYFDSTKLYDDDLMEKQGDDWIAPANFYWNANAVQQTPEGPVSTVTFYARFDKDNSFVKFVYNNGQADVSIDGFTDDPVVGTWPEEPSRTGYDFGGWWTVDDGVAGGSEVFALPATFAPNGTTYYAHWTTGQTTYRFVTEGTEVANWSRPTNTPITDRTMPATTKIGYVFQGWFTEAGGQGTKVEQMPATYEPGGGTFYAYFTAGQSIIRFDTAWSEWTLGDWIGVTDEVTYGPNSASGTLNGAFETPSKTREGFEFVGWFNEDGVQVTGATVFPATESGVYTYTAHWNEVGRGSFTFATMGGSAVATWTGNVGDAVEHSEWPTTTREGYSFGGWFTDSACTEGNEATLPTEYLEGSTPFYAKWNPLTVHIAYDAMGGTLADTSTITLDTITGKTGQAITTPDLPRVVRPGYTFEAWYTNPEFTGAAYVTSLMAQWPWNANDVENDEDGNPVASTTTLYAKWTANPQALQFDARGGEAVTPVTGKTDDAVNDRHMPVTSRTGYTFGGWYTSADEAAKPASERGAAETQLPEKFPATDSGVTTYYAAWDAQPASMVLDYAWPDREGGSTVTYNGTTGASTSEAGVPATLPTAEDEGMARAGYRFEGWLPDSANNPVTDAPATFPANTTVYTARWVEAGNGMFAFVTNGGSAVASIAGAQGDTVADTTMPTTTRAGYTFDGWYLNNGEPWGARQTALGDKYPENTVTYYAKWNADDSFIAFDTHEGSAIDDIKGKTDGAIADRNMPETTRDGYTFDGWYANAEYTGAQVTLLPQAMPVGTVTYHAKWAAAEATVAFDARGGSVVSDRVGTTGAALGGDMPSTAWDGRYFIGWFDSAGDAQAAETAVKNAVAGGADVNDAIADAAADARTQLPEFYAAGTQTFFAAWHAHTSTITFDAYGGTFANGDATMTFTGLVGESTGMTELPTPSNGNNKFDGWFVLNEYDMSTEPLLDVIDTFPTEDVTYTAAWTAANMGSYVIVTNGAEINSDSINRGRSAGRSPSPTTTSTRRAMATPTRACTPPPRSTRARR